MRALPVRLLLVAALAAAAGWLAATAASQAPPGFPACPPGSPALPAPAASAQGRAQDAPSRIIAGRPFDISYADGVTYPQDTLAGSPGIAIEGFGQGSSVTATVAAPGPATFVVRYVDANATRQTACVQSAAFTVNVEAGDPVTGRLGAIEGPEPRWPRSGPPRLPKKGFLSAGPPLVGLQWPCSGTTGRIPVVAEVFVERRLAKKPTEASPAGRLTVDDPCGTENTHVARAPGATITWYGGPEADGGERDLTVVTSFKKGARYWVRITQAGRLLAQARFFTAFRAARGNLPPIWVIAPEAAFEAARCHKPRRGIDAAPLGFRKWPFPPCPR